MLKRSPSSPDRSNDSEAVNRISRHINALKRRYIASRFLTVLSIALVADILFDLLSVLFNLLLKISIPVPFLFEILFVILLSREAQRLSKWRFASLLDHRFHLKDRLYSYVWLSGQDSVPDRVKTAQALECLRAVDFDILLRTMRVRVPLLLVMALPLFLSLLYLTWNAEYRPPGITTRILTRPLAPPLNGPLPTATVKGGEDETSVSGGSGEEGRQPDRTGKEDLSTLAENPARAPEEREATVETPSPGVTTSDPSSGGGVGGSASGGIVRQPENLVSNPESPTAFPPVPPHLAAQADFAFRNLPEASRFLDLVPGQGNRSLAELDPEIISNFESGVERFPDRYRESLQTYYWELKKWSRKQ